ncbi:hypothetical protein NQ126_009850 [Priestia megaterium]|uniref:hypothetical protein n=1 Tax=Priestia megaterium TaxID=1404 RepID=UPI0024466478|nr:hypothetical protein [Priestia megaterium]WRQ94725.1 hypothetical protein NQ126_009850 [Priestia megaterium]
MSINKMNIDTENNYKKFWRSVGVSIDPIQEYSITDIDKKLKATLINLSIKEIDELLVFFSFEVKDRSAEEKIDEILTIEEKKKVELLLLKEFSSRKKRVINNYYNNVISQTINSFENSQLVQLAHLLQLDTKHIAEMFTCYSWESKGTGQVYSFGEKIKFGELLKITNEYADDLIGFLHANAKLENHYKIFSHAQIAESRIVVIIHRKINDGPVSDFDEPFRNKSVVPLLFMIDIENSTLEIRTKSSKEINWINKYIEKTFKINLTEVSTEIFSEYEPETIKEAFLEGKNASGKVVNNFIINKVAFRASPLRNSPRVTFELSNADIIPSLKDAYAKESINLASIKDLETISFISSEATRTIKSNIQYDGSIIFSINDNGLTAEVKKIIENKFFLRFGIPLNQKVSNIKFADGRADTIDYLFSQYNKIDLTPQEQEIFRTLRKENFIEEKENTIYTCTNSNCDYSTEDTDVEGQPIKICPSCGNEHIKKDLYIIWKPNETRLETYLIDSLKTYCEKKDGAAYIGTSDKTIWGNKYRFHILEIKENETIQVLFFTDPLSLRLVNKINTFLTPTIIVCLGVQEKHLDKFNINCTIPLSLGKVIDYEDKLKLFNGIYETFQYRTKSYISSVAYESFETLSKLPEPLLIGEKYKPGDFEDDVFNILIDMFPNAEKWGSRLTGREVPEGIFTLSYKEEEGNETPEYKYVFSFDCKLNKTEKGYDLAKDEQRKAFDYADSLSKNSYISRYSSKNQVSSHIFICNNFYENNFKTMGEYFYRKQAENKSKYDTRPIFITVELLVYLYSQYRKNYDIIWNSRNIFYQELYNVLTTDDYVVTERMIDEMFERALDPDLADYKNLAVKKVKKDVLRNQRKHKS